MSFLKMVGEIEEDKAIVRTKDFNLWFIVTDSKEGEKALMDYLEKHETSQSKFIARNGYSGVTCDTLINGVKVAPKLKKGSIAFASNASLNKVKKDASYKINCASR
jgi:hypothetical protein